ncbi:hypothetical protein LEMLEM_LOCUS26049 [Lemmus lemmus]
MAREPAHMGYPLMWSDLDQPALGAYSCPLLPKDSPVWRADFQAVSLEPTGLFQPLPDRRYLSEPQVYAVISQ